MPPIPQLVRETLAAYQAVADEKRRQWEAGYFPSALRHLGVTTADAKKVMKELQAKIAGEPPQTVIALAKAFAETGVLTLLHTRRGTLLSMYPSIWFDAYWVLSRSR